MTLFARFPFCLNIMIQLANKYSCNWRHQFNYDKAGVAVFGECAVTHAKNMKVKSMTEGVKFDNVWQWQSYIETKRNLRQFTVSGWPIMNRGESGSEKKENFKAEITFNMNCQYIC